MQAVAERVRAGAWLKPMLREMGGRAERKGEEALLASGLGGGKGVGPGGKAGSAQARERERELVWARLLG